MALIRFDEPAQLGPSQGVAATSVEIAMARCAAGDASAIGEVYDAIGPALGAHIGRRVAPGQVERWVRLVMLEVHRRRASYVAGSDVLPWALAIARRLVPTSRTAGRSSRGSAESTSSRRLYAELDRLAEPLRLAWELVCLDRLSPAQAAAVLGLPRASVCAHLERAEAALAPMLHELGGTLDDGSTARDQRRRSDLHGNLALGRYRIGRRLGGGAHGDVYVATDVHTGVELAVKVLRTTDDADPTRHARFLREVETIRRVQAPGVVDVLDAGRLEDGRPCYAMTYVHGRSLAQELRARGRLPWHEVQSLILDLCTTLAAVHACGVVHRDLKPANCLVAAPGGATRVSVLDFGVAKWLAASETPAMTCPGALVGTPEYMAPEQLRGAPIDGRTDVSALGIVMYELLVGRRPFVGEGLVSIISQQLFASPVPPSHCSGVDIAAEVDRIVLRALAKEPGDRYADVGALAVDIRHVDESFARVRALPGIETPTPSRPEIRPCNAARSPSNASTTPPDAPRDHCSPSPS